MLRATLRGAALVAVIVTLLASVVAQEPIQLRPTSTGSWPISPAVIATFITRGEPVRITPGQPPQILHGAQSGPVTLDLLVLWRGSPGWFLQGDGPKAESGGGDGRGHVSVRLHEGGLDLEVALDTEKRVARIAGTEIALGEANVVLVDSVDGPGGLTITGTRSVDPRIQPAPPGLYDVLRSAQDLVPFLRCEARLPDRGKPGLSSGGASSPVLAYMQQVLDASCARIQGK